MRPEQNDVIVYMPTLHRQFLPQGLPPMVLPVWPGLPARLKGRPEGWYDMPFPYSPTEAAACLTDLSRLDDAGLAAFSAATPAVRRVARLEEEERADMRRFARSGELRRQPSEEEQEAETRRWAQRFLLLGWLQEEHVLEMGQLTERYRAGAHKLASHLDGAPGDGKAAPAGETFSDLLSMMRDLIPEDPASLLPSWRFMLEMLSILLPPEAVACTADGRVLAVLNESGLHARPLDEGVRARLPRGWADPEGFAASYVEEPVWRLLGQKSPQAERPWLDRKQVVILLQETVRCP